MPSGSSPIDLIETDDEGTTFDIGQGYTLNLQFDEDSVRLRIDNDDRDEWYAESVARGFFESRQKRNTIANEIEEQTMLSSDFVSDCFLSIKDFVDKAKKEMMPEDGKSILERTESVKAYQTPEDLKVAVWLEAPDESRVDGIRRLEFDGAEFEGDSRAPLKQQHFRAFIERVDIADRDWDIIRDTWLDEHLELEQADTQSADDRIADRVVDVLAQKLSDKVFDAKEALRNSDMAAWYVPSDESDFDEDTVYVQWATIRQVIDRQTDESPDGYSGTLSRTLMRHGVTLGETDSERVPNGRTTLWPFTADELQIEEVDVQEYGSADYDPDDSDDDAAPHNIEK